MSAKHSFDYSVIELVPRVERGERINVGVLLYCRGRDFLAARIALDHRLVQAFAPSLDLAEVERSLAVLVGIAAGDRGMGRVAEMPQADRFHWLVAPRSTMVQTSAVHSGLCDGDDAGQALERVMNCMVIRPH